MKQKFVIFSIYFYVIPIWFSNGEIVKDIKNNVIISDIYSYFDRVCISTNFNNQKCTLLLDSGVKIPILDKRMLNTNSESLNENSLNEFPKMVQINMQLPTIPEYVGNIAITDLFPLSQRLNHHIDGIIPLYFPGYETLIDFRNSKIYWQPITTHTNTNPSNCERVFFDNKSSLPLINIVVNLKTIIQAELDLFYKDFLSLPLNWAIVQKIRPKNYKFARFEKGKTVKYFHLDSLQVAQDIFKNILVTAEPNRNYARLGISFWRNFAFKINFEEGNLCFLSKNDIFEYSWTGIGIILDYFDKEGWKIGVVEDSPAWNYAELRGGEILIKINDTPVTNLLPEEIVKLCNTENQEEILCEFINQDNKKITVSLPIQPLL